MDLSDALLLLLAAGVGAALFFAGREFVRGLKSAQEEFRARGARQQAQPGAGGSADGGVPWHDVLDVPADASRDDIENAYRRLIAFYQPVSVAGSSQDVRSSAEQRAKEITEAYQTARKLRGF